MPTSQVALSVFGGCQFVFLLFFPGNPFLTTDLPFLLSWNV